MNQELIKVLNTGKWKELDNFIINNKEKFSDFFYTHWIMSYYKQRMYAYYKTCYKNREHLTNYAKKCVNELAYNLNKKYDCRVEYIR